MQRAFVNIVFSSSLAVVAQVTPSAQQPLAFTNVIVIDVAAGRTLLNQTLSLTTTALPLWGTPARFACRIVPDGSTGLASF